MGLFSRLGAKLLRAGLSRLGGKTLKSHAKRLGTQAVVKLGGHAINAAASKAQEFSDGHVPGFAKPLANMAIGAAKGKAHGAVGKYGTAGSVRKAIERQRDYGSAGYKLGKSLTPHGGVPKHVRDIGYHGITYR